MIATGDIEQILLNVGPVTYVNDRKASSMTSTAPTIGVIIDLAEADPIVAHILRTHYWFVEERLRQATAVDYVGYDNDWDGIGQRRTGTGTTRFTSVEVTEDDIVSRIPLDAAPDPSYQFAFLQLYLHGLVSGILRSIVTDAKTLIEGRTRGFAHGPSEDLTRDPLLQNALGTLSSTAFASESVTLAAADAIDAAYASLANAIPDADLAAHASLRSSQAKVHIDDIATRAATVLFEVGGASAASLAKNLDRHWRNIRTITLHNPAAYKASAIGNSILNSEPLPFNGYF